MHEPWFLAYERAESRRKGTLTPPRPIPSPINPAVSHLVTMAPLTVPVRETVPRELLAAMLARLGRL